MKCPYCEKLMRTGRIEANNLLQWIPDGNRARGATLWARASKGIVLANFCGIVPATVDACYCPECRKIVIDISKDSMSTNSEDELY